MDIYEKLEKLKQTEIKFRALKSRISIGDTTDKTKQNEIYKKQYTALFLSLLDQQEDLFQDELALKDYETKQVYLNKARVELEKWSSLEINKKEEYFSDFENVKKRAKDHYYKLVQIALDNKTPPRPSKLQRPPIMTPGNDEENGICIIL